MIQVNSKYIEVIPKSPEITYIFSKKLHEIRSYSKGYISLKLYQSDSRSFEITRGHRKSPEQFRFIEQTRMVPKKLHEAAQSHPKSTRSISKLPDIPKKLHKAAQIRGRPKSLKLTQNQRKINFEKNLLCEYINKLHLLSIRNYIKKKPNIFNVFIDWYGLWEVQTEEKLNKLIKLK